MSGRANQVVTRFYWFTDASFEGVHNLDTSSARSGGCDGLSENLDDGAAYGQSARHTSSCRRPETSYPGEKNNGWSLPHNQPRRLLEDQDLCRQAEFGGLYCQRRPKGLIEPIFLNLSTVSRQLRLLRETSPPSTDHPTDRTPQPQTAPQNLIAGTHHETSLPLEHPRSP